MIKIYIDVPYASFRKSYARSYAESYVLPPPATLYGMLLSLVGEKFRRNHEGIKMAFAFKQIPSVAVTLRKLSRYKYGVPNKQSSLGNAPDYVETVCGLQFLCWVDSSEEIHAGGKPTLEERIIEAIQYPDRVDRYGVLNLGLSDDMVNEISLCDNVNGDWYRLIPCDNGSLELPVWVDHLGSAKTRWNRFILDSESKQLSGVPGNSNWPWTKILSK